MFHLVIHTTQSVGMRADERALNMASVTMWLIQSRVDALIFHNSHNLIAFGHIRKPSYTLLVRGICLERCVVTMSMDYVLRSRLRLHRVPDSLTSTSAVYAIAKFHEQ